MSDAHEAYDAAWEVRREHRLRALGTRSPRCIVRGCVETDPFALTGVHPEILCREHLADRQARTWVEEHHPQGQHNDPAAVPVPANDHGALSERQELWPRDTLRNPDGSPLLCVAAALRGWLDVLRHMIESTVGWIPDALERLDQLLRAFFGPGWWDFLGWQP